MNRFCLPCLFGLLFLRPLGAAAPAAELSSFVVDEAKTFSAADINNLNAALGHLKSVRQVNLVILSIPTLGKEAIEDVASRRFRQYKIGEKGVDNGLLFLIVKGDRQMRLEVGYGLEASLPDVQVKRLLDSEVRPYFQQGQYAEGCLYLIKRLAGEPVEIQRPSRSASISWVIRVVPVGLSLFFFLFVYFAGYQLELFPEAGKLDLVFGSPHWPQEAQKYQQKVRVLKVLKGGLLWLYIVLNLAGWATAFLSRVDWVVAAIIVAVFILGFLFIFIFRAIPFSCRWRVWYARYPDPIKSKIRKLLKSRGYHYSTTTETFDYISSSSSASSSSASSDSSDSSSPSGGGESGGGGANSSW